MVSLMQLVVGAVLALLATIPYGFHKVEEGHVGVYWFGGAVQDFTNVPGYHWRAPWVSWAPMKVTIQTDTIREIPCGTSGGVMLYFDKIEVVNVLKKEHVIETVRNYTTRYDQTWVHDKIHHLINEFCSSKTLQEVYIDHFDQLDEALKNNLQRVLDVWAPGIQIVAVRVTKPRIPVSIQKNYEKMEEEKTKLMVAIERQRVEIKSAETEKKKAIISAMKEQSVANITFEKEIYKKQAQYNISLIENAMHLEKMKAAADATYYKALQEVDAEKLLFTDAYLEQLRIDSLINGSVFIYGESIPSALLAASTSPVRGALGAASTMDGGEGTRVKTDL